MSLFRVFFCERSCESGQESDMGGWHTMNKFTERVISVIRDIPEGRVMTYGQIASLAGNRRGARQVARILHSMSAKHNLPWHRVVNASGKIIIANELARTSQRVLLLGEGIEVSDEGILDIGQYQHHPQGLDPLSDEYHA